MKSFTPKQEQFIKDMIVKDEQGVLTLLREYFYSKGYLGRVDTQKYKQAYETLIDLIDDLND